jgi:hypothetical protein
VPLKSTGHHNIRTEPEEVEEPMAMGESVRATAMAKVQRKSGQIFFFFSFFSTLFCYRTSNRRMSQPTEFFL